VRKAFERGIDLGRFKVTDVTEIPGEGIAGFMDGVHVAVGNSKLMEELGFDCKQAFEIIQGDIHSSVCVSVDTETWVQKVYMVEVAIHFP